LAKKPENTWVVKTAPAKNTLPFEGCCRAWMRSPPAPGERSKPGNLFQMFGKALEIALCGGHGWPWLRMKV